MLATPNADDDDAEAVLKYPIAVDEPLAVLRYPKAEAVLIDAVLQNPTAVDDAADAVFR